MRRETGQLGKDLESTVVLILFRCTKFPNLGSHENVSKHVQMNLQKRAEEEEASREGGERASHTNVPAPIGGRGGVVSGVTPSKKSVRNRRTSTYWICQQGDDWQLSSAGAVPDSVNLHSLLWL